MAECIINVPGTPAEVVDQHMAVSDPYLRGLDLCTMLQRVLGIKGSLKSITVRAECGQAATVTCVRFVRKGAAETVTEVLRLVNERFKLEPESDEAVEV